MMVKIRSFLPGRFCRKKGEPPLENAKIIANTTIIGAVISIKTNAPKKSKKGFNMLWYILENVFQGAKIQKRNEWQGTIFILRDLVPGP
jgi:hypothetical protein